MVYIQNVLLLYFNDIVYHYFWSFPFRKTQIVRLSLITFAMRNVKTKYLRWSIMFNETKNNIRFNVHSTYIYGFWACCGSNLECYIPIDVYIFATFIQQCTTITNSKNVFVSNHEFIEPNKVGREIKKFLQKFLQILHTTTKKKNKQLSSRCSRDPTEKCLTRVFFPLIPI